MINKICIFYFNRPILCIIKLLSTLSQICFLIKIFFSYIFPIYMILIWTISYIWTDSFKIISTYRLLKYMINILWVIIFRIYTFLIVFLIYFLCQIIPINMFQITTLFLLTTCFKIV